MLQIHPDVSLVELLKRVAGFDDMMIHLYRNAFSPLRSTVLADFVELDIGDGYAPISVPVGEWMLESTVDHKGLFMRAPVTWTGTADTGQGAFGYYMTNAAGDILLAAAVFDAVVAWDVGSICTVWPVLGDQSLYGT